MPNASSQSNKTLRISAVITAYNCAPFLRDAIESVRDQTRPVDEIIIVDDGSSDDTVEIARSYPDIRVVVQQNSGAGAARNRGIAESSGDIIAFLDCDDIWQPDKTARQLAALEAHPDWAMVSGDKIWWNTDTGKKHLFGYSAVVRARMPQSLAFENCVGNPSMALIRRSIFERVGTFNESLRWGQDWEMWMRIAAAAPVGFIDDAVILYRWHSGNLSHRKQDERLNTFHRIMGMGIATLLPAWQRPFAHLRATSAIELQRAAFAAKQGKSASHFKHAFAAIMLYPPNQFVEKVKRFGRAVIGETRYQSLLSKTRAPESSHANRAND